MDVNCVSCGGLLFKRVPLDEKGNMAMDIDTAIPLEHDGTDNFFRCPHCSVKNIVFETTSPTGLPALKVLKNPYKITVETPDRRFPPNSVPPGSTGDASIQYSAEKAGIKLTPGQLVFLRNTISNIDNLPPEESDTVTHGIEAELNLGIFKFRIKREITTKK